MPKDRDLGEHKETPLVGSVCETSPEKRILTATLCVLNAFFAEFGTRFQSFLVTNFLSKTQGTIFRVKAVTIVYVSLTYVLFHIQHTRSPDMFFDLE